MKNLVFCPCGHSLEAHLLDGCLGESHVKCPCPLDQVRALDAAIDLARDGATIMWLRSTKDTTPKTG